MKIALFGGTGRTGRRVQQEALARGWSIRVLVRDAAKTVPAEGVAVRVGDTRSLPDVVATVEGADAVFCCLGMDDISVPTTDFSNSVRTIIQVMRQARVDRIIAIASAGELAHPDGGYRNKDGLPDWLKHASAEGVRVYEALRDSGLRWTLMCPAFLKEDIPVGRGRFQFEDLPEGGVETGYADLACTMVDLVDKPESFGKRVGIVSFRQH